MFNFMAILGRLGFVSREIGGLAGIENPPWTLGLTDKCRPSFGGKRNRCYTRQVHIHYLDDSRGMIIKSTRWLATQSGQADATNHFQV